MSDGRVQCVATCCLEEDCKTRPDHKLRCKGLGDAALETVRFDGYVAHDSHGRVDGASVTSTRWSQPISRTAKKPFWESRRTIKFKNQPHDLCKEKWLKTSNKGSELAANTGRGHISLLHCLIVKVFNTTPTPHSTSIGALIHCTIEKLTSIGTIGLFSEYAC